MKRSFATISCSLTVIASLLLPTYAMAATPQQILNLADSSRTMTQRLAVQQAAVILISEVVDVDADGYMEAPVMAAGSGPAGGGFIPATSTAPKTDSYGSTLGYCSFDNGATNSSAGRITGIVNSPGAPVFAVVTAGIDNVFQTSCADIAAGTGAKGDDYLISYNSTQLQLGSRGTLYIGDPVTDLATLTALAPAVLHDGELRLTKDTNTMYRWDSTAVAWIPVVATVPPWHSGVGSTYYSNNPIAIGATSATNQLTVVDPAAGVPIGAKTQGQFNGIQLLNTTAGNDGLLGFDNTANQVIINAQRAGAGIALQVGGTSYFSIANTGAASFAGNLNVAGGLNAISIGATTPGTGEFTSLSANGSPVWTNATLTSLSQLSNATTNYITAATAPVTSVAGKTGAVTLDVADISGAAPIANPVFTGQVQAPMGTVALPGYAFTGNSTTGFYMPAASQLAASVNGVRSMWISGLVTSLGSGALAVNTAADSTAVGYHALFSNTTGIGNTATGVEALLFNTTGANSTANGYQSLRANTTGTSNTAIGRVALTYNTTGNGNAALGTSSLSNNTTGSNNAAVGYQSGYTLTNPITGSNSVFFGSGAKPTDNATTVASGYLTLLGSGATANLGVLTASAYSTAVGASASVTSVNTVVLGRTTDKTVIGATSDNGSVALLQVNGASQHVGLASAPAGSAGMIYYDSTLGRYQYHNGTTWKDMTSGATIPLSSLTAAAAANTINNGAFAQAWNWQLTANTTAFNITENVASTGGTGTQYLLKVGTLAGSTATPFAVSTRGVEAFRVDSTNPQILAKLGTVALPTYSFAGNTGTGFYMPVAGQLAASVGGVRSMWMSAGSTAFGINTLAVDTSATGTAVGTNALAGNTTGANNIAIGLNALTANTTGNQNVAIGTSALAANTGAGANNTAIGYQSLLSNTTAAGNTAVGSQAMKLNTTGASNTGVGLQALYSNTTATDNTSIGYGALSATTTSGFNTAVGSMSMYNATGTGNATLGYNTLRNTTTGISNTASGASALYGNTTGSTNSAYGYNAGYTVTNAITGSNSTFIGAGASIADTAPMAGSGYITLLGVNTQASGLGAANANAYMTAIGAGANVTSINTIVLGRTTDKTVIGATADNGSAALLQVNGASQHVGIAAAPAGTAGMLYYNSTTNQFQFHNGTAWGNMSSAALSSLAAASVNNTIANAAFAQAWNWKLTANTAAFNIGETTASTGGTGTQYLFKVGTLAASTAIPLSVSTRGVEAFRVDSTNPQVVANLGSAAAPSYAFNTAQSSGLYMPTTTQFAASVGGVRSMWLTGGSTSVGTGALLVDTSANAFAAGYQALAANTTGIQNTAVGFQSLFTNTTGYANTAVGFQSLYSNTTTGWANTAMGFQSLYGNTGSGNSGVGYLALTLNTTGNDNTALGDEALRYNTIGQYNTASGGYALNANTSGNKNVANGYSTLYVNTTGSFNTATGYNALTANTTGSENTANGEGTLRNLTTGTYNTAIGSQALYRSAAGTFNTAIGATDTALLATKDYSGSYSTFVGANAATSDDVKTAASGYITLLGAGSTASIGTTTAAAYMTAVGAGASVTTANTVALGRAADNVVVGNTAAGAYKFTVTGTAGGTVAWAVSSDRRFKQHITALSSPLATITQLQGVSYEFNRAAFSDRNFEAGRQLGFIAQQIEPFVPEVVRTDKDGYKSVQYSQLVPLLIEGIKEQQGLLQHFIKKTDTTLALNIPVFEADNVVVSLLEARKVKVRELEADSARIKKLEAESIKTGAIKTGSTELYTQAGLSYPLFTPENDAQYIVTARADDGSNVMSSVTVASGRVVLTLISGTGIEMTVAGPQINVMAPGKNVKATWLRMG